MVRTQLLVSSSTNHNKIFLSGCLVHNLGLFDESDKMKIGGLGELDESNLNYDNWDFCIFPAPGTPHDVSAEGGQAHSTAYARQPLSRAESLSRAIGGDTGASTNGSSNPMWTDPRTPSSDGTAIGQRAGTSASSGTTEPSPQAGVGARSARSGSHSESELGGDDESRGTRNSPSPRLTQVSAV